MARTVALGQIRRRQPSVIATSSAVLIDGVVDRKETLSSVVWKRSKTRYIILHDMIQDTLLEYSKCLGQRENLSITSCIDRSTPSTTQRCSPAEVLADCFSDTDRDVPAPAQTLSNSCRLGKPSYLLFSSTPRTSSTKHTRLLRHCS